MEVFHHFSTRIILFIFEDRALVIIVETYELLYCLSKKYFFIDLEFLHDGHMAMHRILDTISAWNFTNNVQCHGLFVQSTYNDPQYNP